MRLFWLPAVLWMAGAPVRAQQSTAACTTLGQTPLTAFPVCGSSVFSQQSVPGCVNGSIPNHCSGGAAYQDANPFWYKFTCFRSGTLGFTIVPDSSFDDYDWEIFDVTGQSVNAVYTNANLIVCYNWSGVTGNTGTAAGAPSPYQCASTGAPGQTVFTSPTPFSTMPALVTGHQYLLMISHYTTSDQYGYHLSFSGGTAVITDTTPPRLLQAIPGDCGSTTIKIGLNKRMLCTSLAPDGSDFVLTPTGPVTGTVPAATAAAGDYCLSGFDMDSVTVSFPGPIPPGNYLISMTNGTDGNTLLDDCSNAVPKGDSAIVVIPTPPPPAPFDSLSPVGCAPQTLTVVFDKNIDCGSVATDGSDFRLTGPGGVTITSASCGAAPGNTVVIQLSAPIYQAGAYQLQLVTGNDGNTIIDACAQQLPAGQVINFQTGDTIHAQLDYQVHLGCKVDTIDFSNPGGHGIDSWIWTIDSAYAGGGPNAEEIYRVFGTKTAKLTVSNGFCIDSATVTVPLSNFLKAIFEATNLLCPNDKAYFSDSSVGAIVSYEWLFGDGTTNSLAVPPPKQYPDLPQDRNYLAQLIVSNGPGCFDTASQIIRAVANCYIAVPSAFTPNGDGINDYLYPLNAYKAANLEFRVYNRYGQLVFQTTDWLIRWDGSVGGQPQAVGTYVWTLRYLNTETGEKVSQKGTSVLIR